MRTFIAIDIPDEARSALADLTSRLRQAGLSGVRWARPEGIHLTLKFLGEIEPAAASPILEAVGRACEGVAPFRLALSDTGCFPNTANPRVIWVGVKGNLEPLAVLHARVDEEVQRTVGLARETRPFTPHLTLGRVHDGLTPAARREIGRIVEETSVFSEAAWRAAEVLLMRSTFGPSGAVYDRLGSHNLRR